MKRLTVCILVAMIGIVGCGSHNAPDGDSTVEETKEIVEREVVVRITIYDLVGKQLKQFYVTQRYASGYVYKGDRYVGASKAFKFKNVTYSLEHVYRDTLDPTVRVMSSKEEFWQETQ